MDDKSSRLPGFYDLSVDERLDTVASWAGLDDAERAVLAGNGPDRRPGRSDDRERSRPPRPAPGHRRQFPGQRPRLPGADGHRRAVGGGRGQLHGPPGARGRRLSDLLDRAGDDRPDAGPGPARSVGGPLRPAPPQGATARLWPTRPTRWSCRWAAGRATWRCASFPRRRWGRCWSSTCCTTVATRWAPTRSTPPPRR